MSRSPAFRHKSPCLCALTAWALFLAACLNPLPALAQPAPQAEPPSAPQAEEPPADPAEPGEPASAPPASAPPASAPPASAPPAGDPLHQPEAQAEGDVRSPHLPWSSPPVPPRETPEPPPEPVAEPPEEPEPEEQQWPFKHFFDHINVRGYSQLRYNGLGATNERLVNVQGDKSMGGGDEGFFFRRIRVILYGQVHPQIYVYFQPDFASAPSGDPLNFTQLRDWYFDLSDPSTEFRVRVGQSKVPFGFENMQSSQNRLPLDRSDALNSAVANERDIGLFFYYAPVEVRRRFKHLVDSGLKGSGDYGMAGIGVYNGQTANRPEQNRDKHLVARLSYPFLLGEQYLELGAAGYAGRYVVQKDPGIGGDDEFRDARVQAHFVLYPQPFGLQAEYNVGVGPELDGRLEPQMDGTELFTGEVRERRLHGGYVLASLKVGNFIPFVRGIYYEGGKKHEKNAPRYSIRELEMGLEWHVIKQLELVGNYTIADRTFAAPPYNQEYGRLFRFQLQVNY